MIRGTERAPPGRLLMLIRLVSLLVLTRMRFLILVARALVLRRRSLRSLESLRLLVILKCLLVLLMGGGLVSRLLVRTLTYRLI